MIGGAGYDYALGVGRLYAELDRLNEALAVSVEREREARDAALEEAASAAMASCEQYFGTPVAHRNDPEGSGRACFNARVRARDAIRALKSAPAPVEREEINAEALEAAGVALDAKRGEVPRDSRASAWADEHRARVVADSTPAPDYNPQHRQCHAAHIHHHCWVCGMEHIANCDDNAVRP